MYSKGSRSLIARRIYNSDYELVQRILHWNQPEGHYSAHPDGSGTTASGHGGSSVETYDYGIPGNFVDDVTETIRGLDAEIRLDAPGHRLLGLQKGGDSHRSERRLHRHLRAVGFLHRFRGGAPTHVLGTRVAVALHPAHPLAVVGAGHNTADHFKVVKAVNFEAESPCNGELIAFSGEA